MSIDYHPSFSGESDPPTTLYGDAVKTCSFNTHSQHQKAAEGHACPPAQTDLAATGWEPSLLPSHDALYRTYHYNGQKSSGASHIRPFDSGSVLPLAEYPTPKRWHKVPLLQVPQLLFTPSVQPPPIEKFVPRPSRTPLVAFWKEGQCDWQKQPATTVPALDYRDIGGERWRWPRPSEVFKWIRGVAA